MKKQLINYLIAVKIISNFAVGFGNIDIEAAKKKNIIVVTNTPDVLTDANSRNSNVINPRCRKKSV